MGLDVRLRTARLYLSTDLRESIRDFGNFVEAAFAGGVDILQVRQEGAAEDKLLEALDLARTISYHFQGLVVVRGDAVLAKKFNGDVLHLGQSDVTPAIARPQLHQWALIGQSVHAEDELRAAAADPEVNYLSVGPVHLTGPAEHPAPGLDLVRTAATVQPPGQSDAKPWFASGSIDENTIDAVLEAGARRVWVTRAITRAPDAEAAASRLSAKLREAWNNDPAMQEYVAAVFNLGMTAEPFIPVAEKPGDPHRPGVPEQ
jgi:thiamine-phosphate pyrophosphorylase